ncbi:MAG TPA: OmpA family protein [Acidobacteriota bacterium]|nr:OmpA family protein [Acidobacteriota bacterium]HRR25060.1 OmpA family protein [Acidobacteriota bacterium]HRR55361.1 OmpA family protein [Acidobacteriota bacterium]HRV07103.1 OmpA family protein [Acidobacteriota bacterium]
MTCKANRNNVVRISFAMTIAFCWFSALTATPIQVPLGREIETQGVIIEIVADGFLMRAHTGQEYRVTLGPGTEIREKKKNPFRGAEAFDFQDLTVGLNVRVKGTGDVQGRILAEKVRFTRDELKIARTISSRVEPVENELAVTRQAVESTREEFEKSLQEADARTQHVEFEVEELAGAFRSTQEAADGARATADRALEEVDLLKQRVESLDDYVEADRLVVTFAFDSSRLDREAQQALLDLANRWMDHQGVVFEIAGFASADGSTEYNRVLSRKRAEAVADFLLVEAGVPVRRIVQPWGFGESRPVADNQTREGRLQNRRVEVRVLRNSGLGGSNVTQVSTFSAESPVN